MKVAITGGTGFIGQYLIPELLKDPETQVRCLTRRNAVAECSQHENLEYVHCTSNVAEITKALCGCDAVIHMASYIPRDFNVNLCGENTSFDEGLDSVRYAKIVFDACVQNGISNIVSTSSIAVYGYKESGPYSEGQVCNPGNMYGVSKLMIEKIAGCYHDSFGLNIKSLRVGQVFGAKLGEQWKSYKGFLRMLAENSLKKEPVTVYGTGTSSNDYVYVRDVCRGILLALQHPSDFGEYNIGNGYAASLSELAEAHCTGFENPAGILYVQEGKEIMFHRSLNIEKARNAWGYEPQYTLVEASKEMYEIYKKGTV